MLERVIPRSRPAVVWVVDDSPTERQITMRSLGPSFEFVQFGDGSEVVEVIQTGRDLPDVLLLDWVMPGMTGDEVCTFLRAQPRTLDLPIILVTATRVETDDVVRGLALGANDYVARPFAAEELRARVNAILRTKQLADTASRERMRLAAINTLGRKLFEAGTDVQRLLQELAGTLTATLCDGCSVLLLPGGVPATPVASHPVEPTAAGLSAISTVADPAIFGYESSAEARASLPPAYHPYIDAFGLRALAILPFPIHDPVEGIVTITRDGDSAPLAPDDIAAIETCIEYASLAVQSAMRFDAERLARAQLDAVLTNAPIGIVVTNPMGAVTLANPAASALIPGIEHATGYVQTFELARWTNPAGEPIDEDGWLRSAVFAPGPPRSSDVVFHPLAGGVSRTLTIATVPLIMESVPVGDITTIEDISARREVEVERERIANFQEQMLGIVGHDLRNPLGALSIGIEALEIRTAELPAAASVVKRMKSSTSRMNRIVEQLLDVTRARLGSGIPITPSEVGLTPMIQGVVDELSLSHPTAQFQIIGSTDVRGVWDVDRLSQVVSNLASNAVQYGRPGEPIIIEVTATADLAILTVTNTVRDRPIDPDRLRAIFNPYQRGRESYAHITGLGLGLYIVSEVVRAHHGTIVATSAGTQTVFRVELPRRLPA